MRPLFSFLLLFSCIFGYSQQVDLRQFHGLQPRNIGPAGMSGRVTAIEVQLSDPDHILIGAAAGGVWQSKNAGHTWTPIFDNELAASIGDIKMYQANPDIIYVASGEGNPRNSQNSGWGMFKSIDGGKTWQHLGLENTRQIHRILIHPDNPDHVVIGVSGATWGTSEERGIYKTTDGGKTWEKTLYINDKTGCADLVVDPSNPNRMLATMWEHQRWPWYFNSGGSGSGMYLSLDAGQTWEEVSDGLPTSTLGRMGLSFAPSNPEIVYAYIESKSNAIYRSEDGGLSWTRRSRPGDRNIGGRPFYYADIYTDTQNENRLYSIATEVTVSEDGGKTWSVFAAGNKLHTDHHAWWSHPTDNEFLIVGHDGGLNITQDRGQNWWFADNLPLAQFYHIRVDNELPYNVMGGLQDNGSWIGPSQVRFKGGIRNYYWQRVSVGDGFDVVPDPLDPNFGYSMGQAGTLYRYHRPSGQLNVIKPVHPKGEYLRFNWNAGIGINPFDQKTIYYGSQYLLKSSDQGESWTLISPDLTSNDTSKQHFLESGGLSYDATGAENHTTIISVAPSSLEKGLIWVGTDDGKVQITRNEGQSWEDLTKHIKGVPAANWVSHIEASKHKPGEAFVVFDDHRRNNWDAYVYRTQNYGQSWERIVDNDDVRGFAYCITQDPIEPNLLFCGTEFGLYVSFDGGKIWNEWTHGYPTVPTTDLVIHPRDHDLVIGTFGRAIWILDDIRPLREMAKRGLKNGLNEHLIAFQPAPAYLFNIGESIGYRAGKVGDTYYNGENRAYGALISYYLKEKKSGNSKEDFAGEVKITIKNKEGKAIRTLYRKAKPGINRLNWRLVRDAPRNYRSPKPSEPSKPRGGKGVVPGKYTIEISYQGLKQITTVEVRKDPEIEISQAAMEEKSKWLDRYDEEMQRVTKVMDQIRDYEADLAYFKKATSGQKKFAPIIKDASTQLKAFRERIVGRRAQGILSQPYTIASMLGTASFYLQGPQVPITPNQKNALEQARLKISELEKDFASYQSIFVPKMKTAIQEAGIELFEKR